MLNLLKGPLLLAFSKIYTLRYIIIHILELTHYHCIAKYPAYCIFVIQKIEKNCSMKKYLTLFLVFAVLLGSISSISSCKTKEGCGLEEEYKADMSSKKRGKSNLWSKKQRKKMKKR